MDTSKKRCFVLDLDGTVYLGDAPIQGTIDFIQRNMGKSECFLLTNNTSKNLADYTRKLAGSNLLASQLERFEAAEMVMVGDRLSTDKLLAENAGIDFILVLSGEAKRDDLIGLARQPASVVDNLRDLG